MHPGARRAHVITHELARQKNEIQNEGLVEAFAETFFQNTGVEHSYDIDVANLEKFAENSNPGLSREEAVRKIYDLYYQEKYEDIYQEYINNQENKDEAHNFFTLVFPELDISKEGKEGEFDVKPELAYSEVSKKARDIKETSN